MITPAKRREAAALVKEGVSVSLAHDVIQEDAADAGSNWIGVVLNVSEPVPRIATSTPGPITAPFIATSTPLIVM